MRALAIVSLAAMGLGCHAPLTEIVLVTRSDLGGPMELDALRFEIDGRALGTPEIVRRDVALEGTEGASLPFVLGLLHEGEETPLGPLLIRVLGLRRGAPRVFSLSRVDFVRDRSLRLDVVLHEACEGIWCDPDETCDARGHCAEADVDAGSLQDWRPEATGLDGGEPSETPSPICAPGESCERSCEGSAPCALRCERGARCLLSCGDAAECGFEVCDGRVERCAPDDDDDDALYVCNRSCP